MQARFFLMLARRTGMAPAQGALSQLRAATDPRAKGGELSGRSGSTTARAQADLPAPGDEPRDRRALGGLRARDRCCARAAQYGRDPEFVDYAEREREQFRDEVGRGREGEKWVVFADGVVSSSAVGGVVEPWLGGCGGEPLGGAGH